MKRTRKMAAAALAAGLMVSTLWAAAPAMACSVPVFRYALQFWQTDPYQATVFYREALAPGEQDLLTELEDEVLEGAARPNLFVRAVDIEAAERPELLELYEEHAPEQLPWVAVQYGYGGPGGGPQGLAWSGPFTREAMQTLVDSPVRRSIAERLLQGQAAVWVLLESGREAADAAAAETVEKSVAELEEVIELPVVEDYVDPYAPAPPPSAQERDAESEYPDGPEHVDMSLLRLDRGDPAEQTLVQMLLSADPSLAQSEEPLLFPVIGRGRVLAVLMGAEEINAENIEMISSFLSGPCSCTVKDQNPGFDLLMSVDWETGVWDDVDTQEALPPLTGVLPTALAPEEVQETEQGKDAAPGAVPEETPAAAGPAVAPETRSPAEVAEGVSTLVRNVAIVVVAGAVVLIGGTLLVVRRGDQ